MKTPALSRLHQLQAHIAPNQALLLTDPADITYFSDFNFLVPEEREGFLIITSETAYLLHASFSPVPVHAVTELLPGTSPEKLATHLTDITERHHLSTVLIDKSKLYADEYDALLKMSQLTLKNLDRSIIWAIRMVKDDSEIAKITQAGHIAADAFDNLVPQIKVGMTEIEIGQLLELEMFKLGSTKPAFPTIVAINEHGALPHHQPTSTALHENSSILIDFGATYQGYRSDITRSFWFGNSPTSDYTNIKQIVTNAYDAVIKLLQESVADHKQTAASIDKAARALITKAGYGQQFIHTTGHGLGLDIHEQPSLNWANELPLKVGMVITVEPGIYLDNKFGYRYENTVVLTKDGFTNVTPTKHYSP